MGFKLENRHTNSRYRKPSCMLLKAVCLLKGLNININISRSKTRWLHTGKEQKIRFCTQQPRKRFFKLLPFKSNSLSPTVLRKSSSSTGWSHLYPVIKEGTCLSVALWCSVCLKDELDPLNHHDTDR